MSLDLNSLPGRAREQQVYDSGGGEVSEEPVTELTPEEEKAVKEVMASLPDAASREALGQLLLGEGNSPPLIILSSFD